MSGKKYDRVFTSRRTSWKNRYMKRCRLLGMIGMRRARIEFEDGVEASVHVLAITPSPLEATRAHIRTVQPSTKPTEGET